MLTDRQIFSMMHAEMPLVFRDAAGFRRHAIILRLRDAIARHAITAVRASFEAPPAARSCRASADAMTPRRRCFLRYFAMS